MSNVQIDNILNDPTPPAGFIDNKFALEIKVPDTDDPTKMVTKRIHLLIDWGDLENIPNILYYELSPRIDFPSRGESNTLYIATDKDMIYRFDTGSGQYINIGGGGGGGGSGSVVEVDDDDVVVLELENRGSIQKITASHAKVGANVEVGANEEKQINPRDGELLIPKIKIDEYGHVTEATDVSIDIKIPDTTEMVKGEGLAHRIAKFADDDRRKIVDSNVIIKNETYTDNEISITAPAIYYEQIGKGLLGKAENQWGRAYIKEIFENGISLQNKYALKTDIPNITIIDTDTKPIIGDITSDGHSITVNRIGLDNLGISTVYRYKGTKTWAQLLEVTNAEIGDVYSISDKDPNGNTDADWACWTKVTAASTSDNYRNYWQSLGGKVDLSGYTEGATSSTDNAIVRFDGTSGKKIQNSTATISDNGHLFINTTSDTTMTTPAINILHTGPADGSSYANLMILSGFSQAPYGFKFKTYGSGTAIIQSQRIADDSETFPLSLNPNGGNVLINGHTAWHAGNDGSDSGLDADLLDGKHASEFQPAGNYLIEEKDTLQTVTTRGAITDKTITALSYNVNNAVTMEYDAGLRALKFVFA